MTDRLLRTPDRVRGRLRDKADMERNGSSWPVMVSAVLLSGAMAAAVAAATVRLAAPEAPGIASVRLGEITAAYTTRAATRGESAEDVRVWGVALEDALDHVAKRRGIVLLPARAVAAGAPDLTSDVEAVLAELLALRTGGGAEPVPGDER